MAKSIVILVCTLSVLINANAQKVTNEQIIEYVKRYHDICKSDSGRLWGVNLHNNIAFIMDENNYVITNFQDSIRRLSEIKAGCFCGNLTDSLDDEIVKKAKWVFNRFRDRGDYENISMIIHDNFHSVQKKLSIAKSEYHNPHIDSLEARVSVRMEWYYIHKALYSENNLNHIQKALFWRNYRRYLFPHYIHDENKFEIHEGLAMYTEMYLMTKAYNKDLYEEAEKFYHKLFKNTDTKYMRSFGYCSGLLYGLALDKYPFEWRSLINSKSDLGIILADLSNIKNKFEIDKLDLYCEDTIYKKIYNEEFERIQKNNNETDSINDCFENNTLLILEKTDGFNFSFNPSNLQMLNKNDMYLPYFKATDAWGSLIIESNGGIINKSNVKIIAKNFIIKDGLIESKENWVLKLNEGWHLKYDEGVKIYIVQKNLTLKKN